jgi:sarcosine oxidase
VEPRPRKRDVLVVGGGVFGLTAAWALVRSGHRVRVLDRMSVPNPTGASIDQHRLVHPLHHETSPIRRGYSQLLTSWETLWRDLDASYAVAAGALAVMPIEAAARLGSALAGDGIAYQVLDARELARRYPHLRFDADAAGVLAQSAGFILAERALHALAHWLIAHDVEIRAGADVAAVGDAAEVLLRDGTRLRGDLLVIAAGAWSCDLVPHWRERVRVYRQVVVYLDPPARWAPAWQSTPAIVDFGSSEGPWAAPPRGGTGLKVAAGGSRRPGDPSLASDTRVMPFEIKRIMLRFRDHIAALDHYRAAGARACFYAVNDTGAFRIDDLSAGAGRVWAIGACAGQGFKWAPAVALAIAAFADGRLSAADLCRWTTTVDAVAA